MKDPSCHKLGPQHGQSPEIRAELRELESRYNALESCLMDPYVVCDIQGRVLAVNSRFEETFGWTIDELLGRRIPFVPAGQDEALLKGIQKTPTGGRKSFRNAAAD